MNNLKNSVQLIGNLGKDPELKSLESGKVLMTATVATEEMYRNTKGQDVKSTQWHRVVAWGKLAENMGRVLRKGSTVALKGKLNHSSYEDAQGNTRYTTSVVVNEFMVLNKGDRA